mmetsp:Transcript_17813/g.62533  ORF Transcript_17813/g.62533 Transcript_17813/m.62533 type:complete len:607 (+) Transcript_17813:60-1880(+)
MVAAGPRTSLASDNDTGTNEPADCAFPFVSLTFKELGFSVPMPNMQTKTILEPCSGHFEPGELVALMGPSGCGKSTLLDMLAMKKTAKHSGKVLVNGHVRDSRKFPRIAVYVGQEDVMPAHWTVREAIKFNSSLKMPMEKWLAKGEKVCDLLLEAFGLTGVADTYIGGASVRGISGGQRRRVTLARGVAAQAPLLFCDEPTSGLSATDAELCIKALRAIAKNLKVLILVVIHQPRIEVAQMFDKLVLLTSIPGRMSYFGPMSQAVAYMEACGRPVPQHVNPTDYFLDLVTPGVRVDASDHLVACFKEKLQPALCERVERAFGQTGATVDDMLLARPGARLGRFAVPFHKQFTELLRRKLAITMRNPLAIALPLLLPAALGAVVGAMFTGIGSKDIQDQISFVFILVTVLGLGGMQLMPILIDERHFMKHEASESLYTEGAAVLASFCVDVPLAFMGAAFQVLLIFAISGMDSVYLPCVFSWSMLLFFVFDSLFGLIAAVAHNASQAQALASPFLAFFMLCNGFIITKPAAPRFVSWVFPVCPNAYAMQAIVVRLAEDAGPVGQFVLSYTGYVGTENTQGVVVMLAMIVVLRILQLVALRSLHQVQK